MHSGYCALILTGLLGTTCQFMPPAPFGINPPPQWVLANQQLHGGVVANQQLHGGVVANPHPHRVVVADPHPHRVVVADPHQHWPHRPFVMDPKGKRCETKRQCRKKVKNLASINSNLHIHNIHTLPHGHLGQVSIYPVPVPPDPNPPDPNPSSDPGFLCTIHEC